MSIFWPSVSKRESICYVHMVLAFTPLAFTPLWLYLLGEGWVKFGGGCKDVVLILPYMIWALFFGFSSMALILKRWPLRAWLIVANVIAIASVLVPGKRGQVTILTVSNH